MKILTGHIENLYNFVADNKNETKELFSFVFSTEKENVSIKLSRNDLSARVMVDTDDVKKKYKTKLIFTVNRLNEYEIDEENKNILCQLEDAIKIKERSKKLNNIQKIMVKNEK